jgi:hypothetical protein
VAGRARAVYAMSEPGLLVRSICGELNLGLSQAEDAPVAALKQWCSRRTTAVLLAVDLVPLGDASAATLAGDAFTVLAPALKYSHVSVVVGASLGAAVAEQAQQAGAAAALTAGGVTCVELTGLDELDARALVRATAPAWLVGNDAATKAVVKLAGRLPKAILALVSLSQGALRQLVQSELGDGGGAADGDVRPASSRRNDSSTTPRRMRGIGLASRASLESRLPSVESASAVAALNLSLSFASRNFASDVAAAAPPQPGSLPPLSYRASLPTRAEFASRTAPPAYPLETFQLAREPSREVPGWPAGALAAVGEAGSPLWTPADVQAVSESAAVLAVQVVGTALICGWCGGGPWQ